MKHHNFSVVIVLLFFSSLYACSPTPVKMASPTGESVQEPSNTPEPATPTTAPTVAATKTSKPTIPASPTIVPTSESAAMEKLINQLYEKGTISSTDGAYHRLDDFQKEWAQLYYYQWWYTDYSPSNFVIQADLEWESASKTANLGDSGCGFVYHTEDNQNHHATFLMMDGKVQTYRSLNNNWTQMKGGYAGKFNTPSDKAHMILIVDNQIITVIVNNKEVVHFEDKKLTGGKLGLTLASGTNKDFGTRCKMTNIELWELPE
ncbi:MAG: hypothetical protein GYA15_07330 [Leptolinea sp.]|jgi:hypothetical protein|nr:hypothetical protein [Leptolinea sp.]